MDAGLKRELEEKVRAGERLTREDGIALYGCDDLAWLGGLAHEVRTRKNGDVVHFNVNRHLNMTNVCTASCAYCSFQRKPGEKDAYTMRIEEAVKLAKAMEGENLTELHIVNGLHPSLPWRYYPRSLSALKEALPQVSLKAFTATEIHGKLGPRGQAAAADAHDDRAHLGALLQDLQPQRALARDDVGVVEGVDEDGAGPLRVLLGRRQRLVDHLAVQPHLGAVLPGGRDLGQRRPDRHEDGGADAQQGRGEGHSLGVVARAGGDHARGPFLGGEPGDPHVRAAEFEGAGALEVLALEMDGGADQFGEVAAALHHRDPRHPGEHLLRTAHVVERHPGRLDGLAVCHGPSVAAGARSPIRRAPAGPHRPRATATAPVRSAARPRTLSPQPSLPHDVSPGHAHD